MSSGVQLGVYWCWDLGENILCRFLTGVLMHKYLQALGNSPRSIPLPFCHWGCHLCFSWNKVQCYSLFLKSHPVLGVVGGYILCWCRLYLHAPKQAVALCYCYFCGWLYVVSAISGLMSFPYHTIHRWLHPIRCYGSTGVWIWSHWLEITWSRTGVNVCIYFKTKEYESMHLSFIIITVFSQDDSSLMTSPVFLFVLLLLAVGCPFSGFLWALLLERLEPQGVPFLQPSSALFSTFLFSLLCPHFLLFSYFTSKTNRLRWQVQENVSLPWSHLFLPVLHHPFGSVTASHKTIWTALAGVTTLHVNSLELAGLFHIVEQT